MKPVVCHLRTKGIFMVIYLDDILCIEKTYESCKHNTQSIIKFLESLGYVINYKKSNLIPSQQCKYLGFIVNSNDFVLELTEKKKDKLQLMIKKFKEGDTYIIRDFAKLLGSLVAACPAVSYGTVYCKRMEREKWLALVFNRNNYDGKIKIKTLITDDLKWWNKAINVGVNPIRTQEYKLEIYSDSSLTGWGAFCKGKNTHGLWDENERKHHINYLELLAAFLSLKCFASELSNSEILLRLDNTTAISYINKTGGIQLPHLSQLAREIWQWCEGKKIIYCSCIHTFKTKYKC